MITGRRLVPPALLMLCLAGCPSGDVGAPCHHGLIQPPENPLVSFPALMCDDLLCVYGESHIAPDKACTTNADCGDGPDDQRFACERNGDAATGVCVVDLTYVLERSMCSKRCGSDADCRDRGLGRDPLADDSACRSGFRCTQVQSLGDLCCEKLCVCGDALADGAIADLAEACEDPDQACDSSAL